MTWEVWLLWQGMTNSRQVVTALYYVIRECPSPRPFQINFDMMKEKVELNCHDTVKHPDGVQHVTQMLKWSCNSSLKKIVFCICYFYKTCKRIKWSWSPSTLLYPHTGTSMRTTNYLHELQIHAVDLIILRSCILKHFPLTSFCSQGDDLHQHQLALLSVMFDVAVRQTKDESIRHFSKRQSTPRTIAILWIHRFKSVVRDLCQRYLMKLRNTANLNPFEFIRHIHQRLIIEVKKKKANMKWNLYHIIMTMDIISVYMSIFAALEIITFLNWSVSVARGDLFIL